MFLVAVHLPGSSFIFLGLFEIFQGAAALWGVGLIIPHVVDALPTAS